MADGTTVLKAADAVKPTRSDPVSPRAARCAAFIARSSERRHLLYAFQESLARRGELRAMGDAVKQRRSDLRLQILDLLAEWRLPDPNLGGGPREVPLLRDRQEIADVTQLHRHLQKQSKKPPTYIG